MTIEPEKRVALAARVIVEGDDLKAAHAKLLNQLRAAELEIVWTKTQMQAAKGDIVAKRLESAAVLVDRHRAVLVELNRVETLLIEQQNEALIQERDRWVDEIVREQASGNLPTDEEARAWKTGHR